MIRPEETDETQYSIEDTDFFDAEIIGEDNLDDVSHRSEEEREEIEPEAFAEEFFGERFGVIEHIYGVLIRAIFSSRESCLIRYSSWDASDRFSKSREYTSRTGRRALVYFAPSRESLCSASLRSRSVVMPV